MPKGIPLTEAQQMRRRKEISDASIHLFLDKGFNETSMREIAKAAGVGKSTLYDYFKSKDEILISPHHQLSENLSAAFRVPEGMLSIMIQPAHFATV